MTDEPETSLAVRLSSIGGSVVGALTPLAAALLAADPASAALAGVLAQAGADAVLGSVGRAAKARAEAAGRELFIEIKARLDATNDAQQRRRIVEDYAADPKRDDVLMEGWKVLFSAPDPAMWPALRRLAIDYWADGRSPDAFFRDASALLVACVADDLEALGVVLGLAVTRWPAQVDSLELQIGTPPEAGGEPRLMAYAPAKGKGYDHFGHVMAPPRLSRILALLKAHGFGHEQPTGRWGGGDPAFEIAFAAEQRQPLVRLQGYLATA